MHPILSSLSLLAAAARTSTRRLTPNAITTATSPILSAFRRAYCTSRDVKDACTALKPAGYAMPANVPRSPRHPFKKIPPKSRTTQNRARRNLFGRIIRSRIVVKRHQRHPLGRKPRLLPPPAEGPKRSLVSSPLANPNSGMAEYIKKHVTLSEPDGIMARPVPPPEVTAKRICRIIASDYWGVKMMRRIKGVAPILHKTTVIHVLKRAKTLAQAHNFFRWTIQDGFKHSTNTVLMMFERLRKAQKMHEARILLFCLPQLRVAWDSKVFSSVILGYGEVGIPQESVKMYEKMFLKKIPRTIVLYRHFLKALLLNSRVNMARRVFNRMKADGVEPDIRCYNMLLYGFCYTRSPKRATAYFRYMKGKGNVKPDVFTYNTVMDAHFRVGDFDSAHKIFDEMKRKGIAPNVVTYNLLINNYCRQSRVDEAEDFLTELRSVGLQPDRKTYEPLINGLLDAQQLQRAQELLSEVVQTKGINPTVNMYTRFIDEYCKVGNFDMAVDTFFKFPKFRKKADFNSYETLIVHLYNGADYDRAVTLLKELLRKGSMPDPKIIAPRFDSFFDLLKKLCEDEKTQIAEELFREMLKKGERNVEVYDAIIRGHCSEGRPEAGFELLNIMLKRKLPAQPEAFTALIDAFLKKNEPADAKYVLDKMLELNIIPDGSVFGSVMESLFDDGRIQTASRVMKSMLDLDIVERVDMFPQILQALSERGHMEEVFYRINLTIEKGCPPDVNALIAGLCEKNLPSTARRLAEFTLKRCLEIDSETYDTILTALFKDGLSNEAFVLLELLIEKGLRPSESCYEKWHSALEAERKDEEAETLKEKYYQTKKVVVFRKKKKRH